jgi:serine/threonine protein kinase
MTNHPPQQQRPTGDDSVPDPDLARTNIPEADTPGPVHESTVVTGSIRDKDWSLGPVPSMPDSKTPAAGSGPDLKNLPAGAVLDDYQIQRVLGTGAFATVYLALQLSLNRLVALKVTGDLGHEGRRMARLEHSNVVQVYSERILPDRRIRLLSMQYVPGPTLQTALTALAGLSLDVTWSGADLLELIDGLAGSVMVIRPDDFAVRQKLKKMDHQQAACFLTAELASGLHYAHSHDVLHRDIKPANILLNASGRPLLVDFNLSEETGDGSADQGLVGGTLAYMSPEHLQAFELVQDSTIPVGPVADVYSLTLVLVQMLNGRVPLPESESGNPIGGSKRVVIEALRELRSEPCSFGFDHPTPSQASLEAVIRRATHPNPEDRTESAELLGQELHSCQQLRDIETNQVMQHPLVDFAAQHPVTVFAFLGFAPQVIASIINIIYNNARVPELQTVSDVPTESVVEAFVRVTIGYNVVIWPAAIVVVALLLKRLMPAIRMESCETEAQETEQRKVVVRLPYYLLFVAAFGWVPGIFVFPIGLWLLVDVALIPTAVHFALNFTTCALLAITYSYLGLAWYAASVCWRRHWHFPRGFMSLNIEDEFKNYPRDLRWARIGAAVVPLLSCMLLIASSDQNPPGEQVQGGLFRLLELVLISLGMLGPLLANRIASTVTERLRTYAGA